MKRFCQFHAKPILNLNISHGKSMLLRSLEAINYGPGLALKNTNSYTRNISSHETLHANKFSHSELKPRLKVDKFTEFYDGDKINHVSLDSNDYDDFRSECNKQEQVLVTQLQMESNNVDKMTNQKWDTLRNLVLKTFGTINEKSIDAVILSKCCQLRLLDLGKSYFNYLKSTKTLINRASYGNYLCLFHTCASACSSDDFNEILAVYNELLEVHPQLDSYTAEKATWALCHTEHWKEYEKLFITIKQLYSPSLYTYKAVIQTAFDKQEFEIGWKLIEELQYQGHMIPEEVIWYWFQKVRFRKLEKDIDRVLSFFNYFNVKPSKELCESIGDVFKDYNDDGKVTFTKINRSGVCQTCNSNLEPCDLSKEDFDELRKAFLNPVVIGKDIFLKTKPEEFSNFMDFLKKSAPFDIVIDGLNVALQGGARSISNNTQRLKSTVQFFVHHKQKVLVLGRKHMATWNTPSMDYVKQNADMFLTDNLSQDDPFMLYATLYSGIGTHFVSRDMMRGHKFLLADQKLQITFQKWQSMYQCFISSIGKDGRLFIQEPVSFLQTVQKNSKGDWHVPYKIRGEELTHMDKVDHLHRHWICMQKKATLETNRVEHRTPFRSEKARTIERPTKKSNTRLDVKKLFSED